MRTKVSNHSIPPALFLIFNRPDLTRQVFSRIRDACPAQLFIGADGPRPDLPGEAALCAETQAVVKEVDWPCQVHTLFRDQNLGCKIAVSSAITWFFKHVEEGIILEDDCLPHPSFFRFCAELLEHHRDNPRVMMISGQSFWPPDIEPQKESYFFSKESLIWGWATWKRAWKHFDMRMNKWPELKAGNWLNDIFADPVEAQKVTGQFDRVYGNGLNTWDYQWKYSLLLNDGLSAVPYRNLVSNIGFGESATHTKRRNGLFNLDRSSMEETVIHPTEVNWNSEHDKAMRRRITSLSITNWMKVKRQIKTMYRRFRLYSSEKISARIQSG